MNPTIHDLDAIPPAQPTRETEALAAHARGWALTPLRGKIPQLKGWQSAPAPTADEVRRWAAAGNVGVRTGSVSGIVIADEDRLGAISELLGSTPWTPTVITGGGGKHFYFATNGATIRNSAGKLAAGLDIRGDGGQVVAAGSIHPDTGKLYRWAPDLSPDDVPLAPFPAVLLEKLQSGSGKRASAPPRRPSNGDVSRYGDAALVRELEAVRTALKRTRNHTLNASAFNCGQLVGGGVLDQAVVERELQAAGEAAGLDPGEVAATIQSGLKAGAREPRTAPEPKTNGPRRVVRPEALEEDLQAATHGDVANSRRFAAQFAGELIHVGGLGWYAWDGTRWKADERAPFQCAKRIADALWIESLDVPELERKEYVKHAAQAQRFERLRAMLALAATEPALAKDPADLDRHAGRLNVANGTIDLESGRLLPHDPLDYHSKIVPIAYDAGADCQRWESFLDRIFAGDEDLICYLHRAIGYSLTASVKEQVWFFSYGKGSNGKSTLFRILLDLLGEYGLQAAPELLLQKHGETHLSEIAALFGARVAVCTEIPAGRKLDTTRVKNLTGGDLVTARKLYQNLFTFEPVAKLWIAGNNKPDIPENDHATWRRIRLIPFNVTIPDLEQDHDLLSKLRDELPGILAWAVAGARLWHARGLGMVEAITNATGDYRDDEDPLAVFLDECCIVRPDLPATPATSLYSAYTAWATAAGIKKPMTQKSLGRLLTDRGFLRTRHPKSRRWAWKGVALHADHAGREWKDGDFR